MRRKRLGIARLSALASRPSPPSALGRAPAARAQARQQAGYKIFFLPEVHRDQRVHPERQRRQGGRPRSSATRVTYNGPTSASAAKQVPFIDTAVRQGYDAIIISANDPNAVAPALKRAQPRA